MVPVSVLYKHSLEMPPSLKSFHSVPYTFFWAFDNTLSFPFQTQSQSNSQSGSNSVSSYSRADVGRGSGLRRSLSKIVQDAERDILADTSDVASNSIDDSPTYQQKPAISLQTLYGAPGGSNRYSHVYNTVKLSLINGFCLQAG